MSSSLRYGDVTLRHECDHVYHAPFLDEAQRCFWIRQDSAWEDWSERRIHGIVAALRVNSLYVSKRAWVKQHERDQWRSFTKQDTLLCYWQLRRKKGLINDADAEYPSSHRCKQPERRWQLNTSRIIKDRNVDTVRNRSISISDHWGTLWNSLKKRKFNRFLFACSSQSRPSSSAFGASFLAITIHSRILGANAWQKSFPIWSKSRRSTQGNNAYCAEWNA